MYSYFSIFFISQYIYIYILYTFKCNWRNKPDGLVSNRHEMPIVYFPWSLIYNKQLVSCTHFYGVQCHYKYVFVFNKKKTVQKKWNIDIYGLHIISLNSLFFSFLFYKKNSIIPNTCTENNRPYFLFTVAVIWNTLFLLLFLQKWKTEDVLRPKTKCTHNFIEDNSSKKKYD